MSARHVRCGICTILVVYLVGPVMGEPQSAAGDPLKKGERIVFLGDSITQAGAGAGGYVTLAREHLTKKYPDLGLEIIGAGISGNRVPDLEARLDRDVLDKKPTL